AKGEQLVFPLVACNTKGAQVSFGYIRDYLLGSPILQNEVAEVRASEIQLTNGNLITCFPNTQSSLRGWSIPCGILDEVGFWRLEGAGDSDSEIQASIRRGMINFERPRLVKISSPYMKAGVLWDDFSKHFGKDDPDLLCWRAPTALMNPTISVEKLEREK